MIPYLTTMLRAGRMADIFLACPPKTKKLKREMREPAQGKELKKKTYLALDLFEILIT
jgi:hypothetical protein